MGVNMHQAGPDDLYAEHLLTLTRRADAALQATGYDALVIHSGCPPMQFLDDQTYPYKVNPHFKAWVPVLDNPRSVLVYQPGHKPRVLFHQPDDYWHQAARMPSEPWVHAVDMTPLSDPAKAAGAWAALGRVACIGPPECFAASEAASINDQELLARLHYDRAVKTPYELECLRRASAIGVRGHLAAVAAFRRGESEYEAHMSYLAACAQREEEMPYNNIVAFNEHAAILHYQHLERRRPALLRSFLIDAGAQYRGYAADITRTYAAAGGRFAELVERLDAAQLRLC